MLYCGALCVQVLLSTAACCWGMTSSAKLVVIMGTQYYDGTGLGASDYPVTDLLQMLGRASRPRTDEVHWLLVFGWADVKKLQLLHVLLKS
jgi:replicative superfamily II helicase